MIYRIALLLAVVASCFHWNTVSAEADDCMACGYGYPFGANRFFHSDRQIPYFAEHPPVYYSIPVPRTYGHSPYAYPGTYRTPEIEIAPAPAMIENPHVLPEQVEPGAKSEPEAETDTTALRRAPKPLVVVNPYYDGSPRVVQTGLAR